MAVENVSKTYKHCKLTSDGILAEFKKEDVNEYNFMNIFKPFVDKEIYLDLTVKTSEDLLPDEENTEE